MIQPENFGLTPDGQVKSNELENEISWRNKVERFMQDQMNNNKQTAIVFGKVAEEIEALKQKGAAKNVSNK